VQVSGFKSCTRHPGLALRNDPVDHFSDGASLQGRPATSNQQPATSNQQPATINFTTLLS